MFSAKGVSPLTPDAEGNTALHYASLASTPEVLDFVLQQSGGMTSPTAASSGGTGRLVDARNADGETAFLRAASLGQLSVLNVLVRNGSDIAAVDLNGNTFVSNAAKTGQLWALHYGLAFCPPHVAGRIVKATDTDGHTALDWACYNGHTNVAEYLMYRGVSPLSCDTNGRNALHWAAKENHPETAAYLVALGMDPDLPDKEGSTARMFSHAINAEPELKIAFTDPAQLCGYRAGATMGASSRFTEGCCNAVVTKKGLLGGDIESSHPSGSLDGDLVVKVQQSLSGFDDAQEGGAKPGCGLVGGGGDRAGRLDDVSPALGRKNPTRPLYAAFYTAVMLGLWLTALLAPVWATFIYLPVVFGGHDNMGKGVKKAVKDYEKRYPGKKGTVKGFMPKLVSAHEIHFGWFFGCVLAFVLVISYSWVKIAAEGFATTAEDAHFDHSNSDHWLSSLDFYAQAMRRFPGFACAMTFGIVMLIVFWSCIVFFYTDPGAVFVPRSSTYLQLLQEVADTGKAPDTRKWCTTTMQRKPLRAKYDAPSGLLVARHDHFCVWLDTVIGFGNHRTFFFFAVFQSTSQLLFSIFGWWSIAMYIMEQGEGGGSACSIVSTLFSKRIFGAVMLNLCATGCTFGIGFLTAQNVSNIQNNITTNERINQNRYPWLQDDEGKFLNRFDFGSTWLNVVDFFFHTVDYRKTFDMPAIRAGAFGKALACKDGDCEHDH